MSQNLPLEDSISLYLARFKDGCQDSANELITKYWPRVIAAASAQLNAGEVRITDEEDVAVSVFDYLCREVNRGQFGEEELNDRNDLWRHLSRLIKHKAIDKVRREKAVKRGQGKVYNEAGSGDDSSVPGLGNFEGISRTPVEQAVAIEEQTKFLSSLQSDELREIVVLRLEGYRQSEIARKMGLTERTIRRKLDLVKKTWYSQSDV